MPAVRRDMWPSNRADYWRGMAVTEVMEYLEVCNWDKFQHYKRNNPAWVKLYTSLFRNAEWTMLTDAQRGQLVMIWLLASGRGGKFPACQKMVKRLCVMDSEPDLKLMIELGFVKGSISTLEDDYTNSTPETETETENKKTCVKSGDLPPHPKIASRFEEFWMCWPNKRRKKQAKEIWRRKKLDGIADKLILDVTTRVKRDTQWLEGYIPNCTTYLNGDLWEDEMTDGKPSAPRHASHKQWEPPEWLHKKHH